MLWVAAMSVVVCMLMCMGSSLVPRLFLTRKEEMRRGYMESGRVMLHCTM